MNKKTKSGSQSDDQKATLALALANAIDAMVKMAGTIESAIARLFDKSDKQAVVSAVKEYVKPGTLDDYKRYMQVARGVKDQLDYEVMPDDNKAHLNDMLRRFREKLEVKARKTKKRKTSQHVASADDNASAVTLPAIGKTPHERNALIFQVLTALDNALGTTREQTLALIAQAGSGVIAPVETKKTSKKNAA